MSRGCRLLPTRDVIPVHPVGMLQRLAKRKSLAGAGLRLRAPFQMARLRHLKPQPATRQNLPSSPAGLLVPRRKHGVAVLRQYPGHALQARRHRSTRGHLGNNNIANHRDGSGQMRLKRHSHAAPIRRRRDTRSDLGTPCRDARLPRALLLPLLEARLGLFRRNKSSRSGGATHYRVCWVVENGHRRPL